MSPVDEALDISPFKASFNVITTDTRLRNLLFTLALTLVSGLTLPFRAPAQLFTNLHSLVFTNGTGPVASLLVSGNTVYGTTRIYGGGNGGGYGSVFKMAADGSSFTALHIFSGYAPEGGNLNSSLIPSGGMLYGTAAFGGDLDHGCIFAISTDGTVVTNVYSFTPLSSDFPSTNSDGAYPIAGLVLSGSRVYGLANSGGANGWGSVFAVNINGTGFTNLHSFGLSDGQYPAADLILSGSTLYGITPGGGAFNYGTIFKLNINGSGFTNLYSFTQASGSPQTNSDGAFPACSLALSGNTLYGTAAEGGNAGSGTIFKINTDGSDFGVLHHFTAMSGASATNNDGARPHAGLILSGGTLYGTASLGGTSGNGTLFRINTDSSGFATIYSFTPTNGVAGVNADGAHPLGGLILSGGALYGTASAGGASGYGTVFSVTLPPTLSIALAGPNVILTWPSNFTGFNLQSTTNLTLPVFWSAVAGQYTVTDAISGRQKFHRLMHP
jgi:uncharacterized repeat protein (TIGR03803 family)